MLEVLELLDLEDLFARAQASTTSARDGGPSARRRAGARAAGLGGPPRALEGGALGSGQVLAEPAAAGELERRWAEVVAAVGTASARAVAPDVLECATRLMPGEVERLRAGGRLQAADRLSCGAVS